mgnify:CR=1 FL=1
MITFDRKGVRMNYEQEFEILAVLCPITPRESAIAARAIVLSRESAIVAEMQRLLSLHLPDTRLVELAVKGLEPELNALRMQLAEISERIIQSKEETKTPRRGRPKGSKTKPKPGSIVVDTLAAGSVTDEVQQ